MEASRRGWLRRLPVLRGVLPVRRSLVAADIAAGLTPAALGIPEVLGYARIAGMPVATGLYTLLLDYTAGLVLRQVIEDLHDKHVFVAISSLLDPVRRQLDRYGIRRTDGPDAYYETPGEALEAYHAAAQK